MDSWCWVSPSPQGAGFLGVTRRVLGLLVVVLTPPTMVPLGSSMGVVALSDLLLLLSAPLCSLCGNKFFTTYNLKTSS